MNHRSANRGIPPSLLRPIGRPEASAKNKPTNRFTTTSTFVEDFNREHSSSSAAGGLVTMDSGPARTSNAFPVTSPNCVYLG
jgi:hypothetical protein